MQSRRTTQDAGFLLPESSKKRHLGKLIDSDDSSTLPLPSPSASPTHNSSSTTNSAILSIDAATKIHDRDYSLDLAETRFIDDIEGFKRVVADPNILPTLLKMIKKSDSTILSSLFASLSQVLKKDFLTNLPSEITLQILSTVNHVTLCNCLKVSKQWNKVVSSYPELWKNLLIKDNLATLEEYTTDYNAFLNLNKYDTNMIPRLIYERRYTILNKRWMDPTYIPKTYTLVGDSLNFITCLQFDKEKIATGSNSNSNQILIYDTESGALQTILNGHTGGVWAMKFFKDTLASGATDRSVRIWNLKYGVCTHIFRCHTSTVRCMEIIEPQVIGTDIQGNPIVYPETPLLVTGSRDSTSCVWKLPILGEDDDIPEQPIELDAIDNPYLLRVLKGHTDSVRAITGHANILITGSYDSTARVWDLKTGECLWVLKGHKERIYSCVYDFKRNTCFTGSMDTSVRIWDLNTGETVSILDGHQILVGLVSSSENVLVSAAADSTVRIWDPDTGRSRFVLRGHSSAITCVVNDDYKVISGSQGMLKLWNPQTGEFVRDLVDNVDGPVWQVASDFRRCVSAVKKNDVTYIQVSDFCPPEDDPWMCA